MHSASPGVQDEVAVTHGPAVRSGGGIRCSVQSSQTEAQPVQALPPLREIPFAGSHAAARLRPMRPGPLLEERDRSGATRTARSGRGCEDAVGPAPRDVPAYWTEGYRAANPGCLSERFAGSVQDSDGFSSKRSVLCSDWGRTQSARGGGDPFGCNVVRCYPG